MPKEFSTQERCLESLTFFERDVQWFQGDVGDFGFIVIGDKERQVQEVLGKIRANFRLVDFKSSSSKKNIFQVTLQGQRSQTVILDLTLTDENIRVRL